MKQIPLQLRKKPFSTQMALKYGLSRNDLVRLVAAGVLERLSRGIYQVSTQGQLDTDTPYHSAIIRCGEPSAICLLSALEHYHLIDEIPRKVWVLVPHQKRVLSKDLKLIRSRQPNWNVGIEKKSGYWITSIERTLIECMRYKNVVGSQVAIAAIKQALQKKKVKLGALYDMAKKLKLEKKIQPYIEALTL